MISIRAAAHDVVHQIFSQLAAAVRQAAGKFRRVRN